MKIRNTCLALAMLALGSSASAQTTLAAGDISFTGLARESAYGGFSFVSWVDLAVGTSITFSDNGLKADGTFKTSVQKENTWVWTATSAVAAGTQVVVYGGNFNTATGTVSGSSSGQGGKNVSTGTLAIQPTADAAVYAFDFSSSGEVVYAKQGASFIAAINAFATPPSTSSDNPLASGLGSDIQVLNYASAGGDAVFQRTEWYRGPTTGLTVDGYKAAIGTLSNWSSDTGTSAFKGLGLLEGAGQTAVATGAAVGVGAGDFTIVAAPVPEPETYALMLAGIAVVGGIARRRGLRR